MTKRRFEITLQGTATIELDSQVIDVVNDEWHQDFYELKSPEKIAEFIGRLLICYDKLLSDIDGWADQPDKNARIVLSPNWHTVDIKEIQPKGGPPVL